VFVVVIWLCGARNVLQSAFNHRAKTKYIIRVRPIVGSLVGAASSAPTDAETLRGGILSGRAGIFDSSARKIADSLRLRSGQAE